MYAVEQDLNGIANINPYRYRSYYYDAETGMYYLQSRYYNPAVGRFVNGDDILDNRGVLGLNLFAYCWNRPAIIIDPNGHWVLVLGGSIGVAVIAGANLSVCLLIDSTKDYGIFIGVTAVFGFLAKGLSGSAAFYWKYKKIKNFLNAVTVTFGGGCTIYPNVVGGGAMVYDYYNYPYNDKMLVAIQISYGTVGLYRETAPIDGGLYIPLKGKLSKFLKSCGKNVVKIRSKIKKLKIKIKRR